MRRRSFIIGAGGVLVAAVAGFLTMDRWLFDKIAMRVRGWISSPPEIPQESEREIVRLPAEGQKVSVELALNSRCNSDYTANQKYIHWGMFDPNRILSSEQLKRIIEISKVPHFTAEKKTISTEGRRLTFSIDSTASGIERQHLMVESGMQQQAVCLVCAALGVGMAFRNLGIDGQVISNGRFGTVRMDLDAMKPSYSGSFWTSGIPTDRKPWIAGNLPDPHRDGKKPLLQVLESLDIRHEGKSKADFPELGQLLWAAKGRSPHLYKSKPWALTVPFWTDRIETTSVYLLWNRKVYKYVNWDSDRPTHSILEIRTLSETEWSSLVRDFSGKDVFIVLGRNDDHNRAFWEIGYELTNLLVQAKSAEMLYSAHLLSDAQATQITQFKIRNPVALVAL